MTELDPRISLAGILVLGVLSQWAASLLRLPSILFLLTAGILAGPILGLLHPQDLLGDLLLPIVSLCVAIILFEGGLSLRLRELTQVSGVFIRLSTVGVLVAWLGGATAAHYLLDFSWSLSCLLGAILVVTGPTVIGPLLRHLRLGGQIGTLLKWEGIVIDPLGAILAVLVFAFVHETNPERAFYVAAEKFMLTIVTGTVFGVGCGWILTACLRRYWITDSLQNAVTLLLVIIAHTVSNAIHDEAGLLAVTVMGLTLANQRQVSIKHLIEFKENLTVLLISILFVILAAKLRWEEIRGLGLNSFLFVASLIFLVRPASVFLSTFGTKLRWKDRVFLSCMAPRGIVAVAVTSVFALEMAESGHPEAEKMIPVTFLVVFVTVLLYGLAAGPIARTLELIKANPQGVLILGAHSWARAIASVLQKEGRSVMLVDTDWDNICFARMAGLPCHYGSILADRTKEEVDFSDLGRLMALSSNNEVNSLACLSFVEIFGRRSVYQLPFQRSKVARHDAIPMEQRGRFLFREDLGFDQLTELFTSGVEIKRTPLTKEFDLAAYRSTYGEGATLLFLVKPNGQTLLNTLDEPLTPEIGDTLISLIRTLKGAPAVAMVGAG